MADLLENVFNEHAETAGQGAAPEAAPFDVEAYKKRKQDEVEQAFRLVEDETVALGQFDGLHSFLDVRAQFDRYSVSNVLLIAAQRPDAIKLASYTDWAEKDAQVKKGEHSILLFDKVKEYTKRDGTPGKQYQVKRVFDIKQTTAKTYPAMPTPPSNKELLLGLLKASPVECVLEYDWDADRGIEYSAQDNKLHVPKALSTDERVGVISIMQKICLMRTMGDNKASLPPEEMAKANFRAYCTSYILCKRYAIPPDMFPEGTAKTPFAGMKSQEIRQELEHISKEANNISYVVGKIQHPDKGEAGKKNSRRSNGKG